MRMEIEGGVQKKRGQQPQSFIRELQHSQRSHATSLPKHQLSLPLRIRPADPWVSHFQSRVNEKELIDAQCMRIFVNDVTMETKSEQRLLINCGKSTENDAQFLGKNFVEEQFIAEGIVAVSHLEVKIRNTRTICSNVETI